MEEELLIRFLTRQCSAEETVRIARWIEEDQANAARLFEMERIWMLKDEAKHMDAKEINAEYNRLVGRLAGKALFPKTRALSAFHWLGYAAAVVLLGILSINFYMSRDEGQVTMNIVEVPNGQRVSLTLGDGTKVLLNSGSRFTYPSNFSSRNRVVELSGEGFFEVTKQDGIPFVVNVSLLDVKVLGTKFNVKAYANENAEVTLEQGVVEVFVDNDVKSRKSDGLALSPNQQLLCTPDKQLTLKEVDASESKKWLEGGFFFENQSLSSIVKELERRFGVNIQIKDMELAEEVFTCHTKAEASLPLILDALKETKGLTYIRKENTYILLTAKEK